MREKVLLVLLVASLMAAPVMAETKLYYGERYAKTLTVVPSMNAVADTDYTDGTVYYIYKLWGIYSLKDGSELVPTKQVQLDSVSTKTPITCSFDLEITEDVAEGKYIAICSVVGIPGTFDTETDSWVWGTHDDLGKESDVLEVKKITPPQPPPMSLFHKIILVLIDFFKSLFGLSQCIFGQCGTLV